MDMENQTLKAIEDQTVMQMPEMVEVPMTSLWEDQTVVIAYFRRFGCMCCRQGALELSKIAPLLRADNIRLVGIGLEEIGYKEFVEDKCFDGEIYLDIKHEQYKAFGFKKYNIFSIWFAAFYDRRARTDIFEGIQNGMKINFEGDWYQTGGMLIVEKGGSNILLFHKAEGVADHVENLRILEAVGLGAKYSTAAIESSVPAQP